MGETGERRSSLRRAIAVLSAALLLAVGLAGPVYAGARDMLLCLPGFPGTTVQAQPYIDKMLRHLEDKLGLEARSMSGVFIPDGGDSVEKLKSVEPGLALVGPSVLAGNHGPLGMKVIARLIIDGKSTEKYSVVVAKGGPASLKELSGKKVSGAVVHDEKYVVKVLLDGAVGMGDLQLVSQRRPLKSLRDVARGKAAAAIVDSSVIEHMSELDFAKDLEIIHESKPVPAPAIVLIGEGPAPAKRLKKELVGMCKRPDGQELCKTLTVTAIEAASNADYKALFKRYGK